MVEGRSIGDEEGGSGWLSYKSDAGDELEVSCMTMIRTSRVSSSRSPLKSNGLVEEVARAVALESAKTWSFPFCWYSACASGKRRHRVWMSSCTDSSDETSFEDDEVWAWAEVPAVAFKLKSFPSISNGSGLVVVVLLLLS